MEPFFLAFLNVSANANTLQQTLNNNKIYTVQVPERQIKIRIKIEIYGSGEKYIHTL